MTPILAVSKHDPSPMGIGCEVRFAAMLAHYRDRGDAVHRLRCVRYGGPRTAVAMSADPFTRFPMAGGRLDGVMTTRLKGLLRPPKTPWRRLGAWRRRRNLQATFNQLVARSGCRVLHVDFAYLAPLVAGLPAADRPLTICDTHDVGHQRVASMAAIGLKPTLGMDRAKETALLSTFDVVVAIQEEERAVLQTMLPGRRVITVGMPQTCRPQPSEGDFITCVGSFSAVNLHGLLWWLAEAWPTVRRDCPTLRLRVFGSVCDHAPLRRAAADADAALELVGRVPDITVAYDGAAAVICPLWAGSGLKIKVVEAMAHGKAVVGSPIAAQGLDAARRREALRVAGDADAFARAVVELVRNGAARRHCAAAALAFVQETMAPSQVFRELDRALDAGP